MHSSAKAILCAIAISMVVGNSLRGDVYTTSVTLNVVNGQGGISATTQPNHGGDGAILGLAIDGSLVLRPTSYSVGIGHVWYSVTPGTVIDPAFAMTAPAFANAFTGNLNGSIQLVPGQTYLLGFWLDANGNSIPGLGDRFGWASFTYNSSSLTLVGNAIESTGAGIIAGTTTAVPEPSSALLLLLGLVAMPAVRRLKRAKLTRSSD